MKYPEYKIRQIQSTDDLPFGLLLLADETIHAIEKYIYKSDVYVVSQINGLDPIAVFALFKNSDEEIEIKNIAVSELLQGRGIGSYIIEEIRKIVAASNYQRIIVGTPDCALTQIQFYEKNGFKKYAVRKDFFLANYSEPIIENGVLLKDMLMFRMCL